jgi:thiol-disulfide isomerase/thioredoxin
MLHSARVILLALLAAKAPVLQPVAPADYVARVVQPHAGKVLVVAFWASYCAPCMEELPSLVALDAARKDVDLVLVSTDPKEWRGKAGKAIAKVRGVPLFWVDAPDPQPFIDVVDPAWQGELPYAVVYDGKGARVVSLSGAQDQAAVEAAIVKASGRT